MKSAFDAHLKVAPPIATISNHIKNKEWLQLS